MANLPKINIAPSILSADFAKLGQEIHDIEAAGADWIHIDVMDGHFVPNLTIGPAIVKAIRPHTKLPFDVHLMIEPADPYLEAFAHAGADIISIHPEAVSNLGNSLIKVRNLGKKAGVVLNPATPTSSLENIMDSVDLILVMTVNPGFGGQKFIDSQIEKIQIVRQKIDQHIERGGTKIDLSVDGGINVNTAKLAVNAGANILVAGTAAFIDGPSKYARNLADLRNSTMSEI